MITIIARTLCIILFAVPIILSISCLINIIFSVLIPEVFIYTCVVVFLLDVSILVPLLVLGDP